MKKSSKKYEKHSIIIDDTDGAAGNVSDTSIAKTSSVKDEIHKHHYEKSNKMVQIRKDKIDKNRKFVNLIRNKILNQTHKFFDSLEKQVVKSINKMAKRKLMKLEFVTKQLYFDTPNRIKLYNKFFNRYISVPDGIFHAIMLNRSTKLLYTKMDPVDYNQLAKEVRDIGYDKLKGVMLMLNKSHNYTGIYLQTKAQFQRHPKYGASIKFTYTLSTTVEKHSIYTKKYN
uniref:Uncharacterized protein n=1 Tax=viral metagenome TaxID=1070528 RepID=A0A6C0CJY5_9ZZZZ